MRFKKSDDSEDLKNVVYVYSCCLGETIALEKLGNDAFSSLILGEGFGVIPSEGEFFAPCDGAVRDVSRSKTEVTIKMENGLILIVSVKGQDETRAIPCECFVAPNDMLKAGDRLFTIGEENLTDDISAAVIITNSEKISKFNIHYGKVKQLNQVIMEAVVPEQ